MAATVRPSGGDRQVWPALFEQLDRLATARGNVDRSEITVLDVGGGTGGYAVPLAQCGHPVTVLDPSPDALATLRRRSVDAGVSGLVTPVLGDADLLGASDEVTAADLVLVHQILEYVDDPGQTLGRVAAAVRPGGVVSLIVQMRAGAVIGRALSGRIAEATAILRDPDGRAGRQDPLLRRFDPEGVDVLLADAGLTRVHLAGVDLLGTLGERRSDTDARTRELDAALSVSSPYRELATTAHVLAVPVSRPDG